jgi:Lung seven transmembrane receptor
MNSREEFNASIRIRFRSPDGFLTAKDLPMLSFYGVMCTYYLLMSIVWLTFSAIHWKELLRIQFWVGAVILLAMIEKSFFYFEYGQANEYGFSSLPLALIAELVSIAKF